jgi:hypothetical protein
MKTLPFILLLALIGCSRSVPPDPLKHAEILKWVPLNSSLASARQTMEQHGYSCLVITNKKSKVIGWQPNDGSLPKTFFINGVQQTVTNASSLICQQSHEEVLFTLLNGVVVSMGSGNR